jgi:hypothetical protein
MNVNVKVIACFSLRRQRPGQLCRQEKQAAREDVLQLHAQACRDDLENCYNVEMI